MGLIKLWDTEKGGYEDENIELNDNAESKITLSDINFNTFLKPIVLEKIF